MKWVLAPCLLALLPGIAVPVSAQNVASASVSASNDDGTPIAELLAAIAKKTGKKVIAEPRVQARIHAGDVSRLSYDEFLSVLEVYGFVAVERGDTILVLPDVGARTLGAPLVSGNEKHPDAQVVTRIIHVKSMPAASLVPIMRPLIPSFGHLAASGCTNDLILVDRFANVKRIDAIIQAMDEGEPYKVEKCSLPSSSN
jgi:general secretion pathway protein D